MKAVQIKSFGGPEQLFIGDYDTPTPGDNEILVKVAAAGINRADTLQRAGKYPPPKGESEIMGLEMSGTVISKGGKVSKWEKGDRVCGLLSGGGYATHAVIHEDMALAVPDGMSHTDAAAIPEVFLTAFQAIRWLAKLQEGERILIHAGASGVGTAAIQLSKIMGAIPYVTASNGKHAICKSLGATLAIDYKSVNFADVIAEQTAEKGVDVIIDFVGGPYFQQNLASLATEGRMVMLAFLGTPKLKEANLAAILRKRLHIMGSTLRARSLDYKIRLTQDLFRFAWPFFADATMRPVVDSVRDWKEVADAHRYMEANKNKGKIILAIQ